jgi:membrane fusion protein (multidrug efflux system)
MSIPAAQTREFGRGTRAGCRRGAVAAAFAIALASAGCGREAPPQAPPPPPEVYVTDVVQQDVPVYLELVGQASGYQDVEVRARVEGFLDTMNFREGSFITRGTLLYTIDRKPLQATLAAAQANQVTAEARLQKATNDVNRYTPLAAKQAVSQQELDNARAAQDAARSEVEAAKANVESATLDLGYTRVVAPIDGLVGTTLVKPGNLVGRGENTLLTTVSQIDPILFRVGVTEADYLRIVRRNAGSGGGAAASDIELTLADGTVHPHTGKVETVDRAVDPTTGTLGVQFAFPNPDKVLRPGQYGRARVLLETKANALLVPQRAVQELQNLYSVATVDSAGKVGFRNVKVGLRVGSRWVIEEGLRPGDRVITEGLQRVQDGMTVTAKAAPPEPVTASSTTPAASSAPPPAPPAPPPTAPPQSPEAK